MADKSKVPPSDYSNDEIIEELTKDLRLTENVSDNNVEKDISCNNHVSTEINGKKMDIDAENVSPCDGEKSITDTLDTEVPKFEGDENDANASESDLIEEPDLDEEEQKNYELSLTEEEKESMRIKSVQEKDRGNALFKEEKYLEAFQAYTSGLKMCPLIFSKERSIIYSNRAATKIKLGRNKSALEDCNKAIDLDPEYVRAIIRRAKLREEMKELDDAFADWKRILELQPDHQEANVAVIRLPPKIAERNEELKAEMLDKLKSLGNVILRPFGLSTDNFKMVPNGDGGYSIQFGQNK
jgi:tetratricopeptide (TPR) repeat protein